MDVRITVIFNLFLHEGLKGEKGLTEGIKNVTLDRRQICLLEERGKKGLRKGKILMRRSLFLKSLRRSIE